MGLQSLAITTATTAHSQSAQRVHKLFLATNYVLLGAASSCIFLTLSLRLFPSLYGFFLILLHIVTIVAAAFSCASSTSAASHTRWYTSHMVSTVLTAIFEGSVSVLIFTRPADFLTALKSYVKEDDAEVILKLAGGLCVLIFCLEWVVLGLAFVMRYYAYTADQSGAVTEADMRRSAKVQDSMSDWPWPFQV
ncbi:unnamed protein product [Victoria cruziana]